MQRQKSFPFKRKKISNPIAIAVLSSILILAILIAGCAQVTQSPKSIPNNQSAVEADNLTVIGANNQSVIEAENQTVIEANNQFALDLYTQLTRNPENMDANFFFSPFSISSALAITYEGARGTTAKEILNVFHFPANRSVMREEFSESIARINNGSSNYTLRTANALWAEKTYPFLLDYRSVAERYYSANTTNLDFINNSDMSRVTINRWVEDQTAGKIKDLLPAGTVNPLTRLVITNAIYFKGTWVKQFDKKNTTEEDFRIDQNTTVRVPMMRRTDKEAIFGYTNTSTLQALEMPYESNSGEELSMLILLPKKGVDLGTIEQSLNVSTLSELQQAIMYRRVMVYFPKFTIETKYFLPQELSEMGMPTAFTTAADFSGMDGTKDLYIDNVIHQAFVDVNEEGTEAAAATGATIGLLSLVVSQEEIPVFRADHPFIFFIKDNETGNILFMGRIVKPVLPGP